MAKTSLTSQSAADELSSSASSSSRSSSSTGSTNIMAVTPISLVNGYIVESQLLRVKAKLINDPALESDIYEFIRIGEVDVLKTLSNVVELKQLLYPQEGYMPNKKGFTPLHYAASTNQLGIVKELLAHGARSSVNI